MTAFWTYRRNQEPVRRGSPSRWRSKGRLVTHEGLLDPKCSPATRWFTRRFELRLLGPLGWEPVTTAWSTPRTPLLRQPCQHERDALHLTGRERRSAGRAGPALDDLIEVGEPLDISGAWKSNAHTELDERRHLVAPHRTAARTVLIER